jgi:hypothetical protein
MDSEALVAYTKRLGAAAPLIVETAIAANVRDRASSRGYFSSKRRA